MISAWWLLLTFFLGTFFGVLITAIMGANRGDDDDQGK